VTSLESIGVMRGTQAGEGTATILLSPVQGCDNGAEFRDNPGQIYGRAEGTCPPSSGELKQPWQPKHGDIN